MSPRPLEPVTVCHTMDLEWRYASGAAMQRFCEGLLERRIRALRCDSCGRRYLPPRPFCGRCRADLRSWVDVRDEGTLEAFTVVHLPIVDGRTGLERRAPYATCLVRLDGADTTVNHFLAVPDGGRLARGTRVRALWRPGSPQGTLDDILHFEVAP